MTSTKTTYGDGVFQLLTGGAPPPGYAVLEAFALEVDPGTAPVNEGYSDGVKRPVRFICTDECQKCTSGDCSPTLGLPEPQPPTTGDTTTAHSLAVRSGETPGWSFADTELALAEEAGPVFVSSVPPNLDTAGAESVRTAVASWLGPQATPVIVHLFRLRDPSGTHLLHDKIIGIPVPVPPT